MNPHRTIVGAVPASFLAACQIPGMPRVALAPPDAETAQFVELARSFMAATDELKGFARKSDEKLAAFDRRLYDTEQKAARRSGPQAGAEDASPGRKLIESEEFKALSGSTSQRGSARVEVKALTMVSAAGSGGALVPPDYKPDPVLLPQRRMTVRSLIASGTASGGTVSYPRQTVRNLGAATVAETLLKPQSDIEFELVNVPVVTTAHWMLASRQVLDDAPQLQSIVDSEMRYGLDLLEEAQWLYGDGTGSNFLGIIPQAQAFNPAFAVTGQTTIDTLALSLNQADLALLPATGIVLHPSDWRRILLTKDGQGRYIVGDPLGQTAPALWGIPVIPTLAMLPGTFLVGAFAAGAQYFDRMQTEVLVSSEDSDNFRKNLVTIRAERRTALTVKRPQAFVTGTFGS